LGKLLFRATLLYIFVAFSRGNGRKSAT
jgi:hypothetical protein